MRSLATRSRRSSSRAYSSRTLPLPTCRAASGMNRFLLLDEGVQAVEDGVDMTDGRGQVEDGVEVDAAGGLAVRPGARGGGGPLFPGAQPVGLARAASPTAPPARPGE